ncbi:MAG: hypothetical protein ABIZ49_12850 [Opitutaceae bacterium]
MKMLRACLAITACVATSILPLVSAAAAVPDYKLGDVAAEDVVTPVQLLVVNPDATEALKAKVAQQIHLVIRYTPQTAGEAEKDLRDNLAAARRNFIAALQALGGRGPSTDDVDSAAYKAAMRDAVRDANKDLPLDRLAPLWVRGASDSALVESLVQPLREAMAQPIVASKTETSIPGSQPVRIVPLKNAGVSPTVREIENAGPSVSAGKVISLWRAKRLVETYFPAGQDSLGRFAATFVRVNAMPDPSLTEIWRAERTQGVTVNDTYEAAETIVRKGQAIDRKALSALAAMREKSLIGTLQTKLEQEQSVAGQIQAQTKWIAAGLGVVVLALVLILGRLRSRPGTALVPVLANPALAGAGPQALPEGAHEDSWRSRALVAEGKAERAQEAIRAGVLGWMREKIVQTLFRQRADLLSVQQKAEAEMRELEQRLEQLHTPLQERITAYEKRIVELEKDLAAKGEENRELIGARISVARQQLNVERERGRFGTN